MVNLQINLNHRKIIYLQTHNVYSTLKRHGNDLVFLISGWFFTTFSETASVNLLDVNDFLNLKIMIRLFSWKSYFVSRFLHSSWLRLISSSFVKVSHSWFLSENYCWTSAFSQQKNQSFFILKLKLIFV